MLKNFLNQIRPQTILPYLAAIVVFVILTLAYVGPVLEGKRLLQPDIVNWQGMSKEVVDHRAETTEEALWTNSMFGGMPAFQISVVYANNIADFLHNLMTLWLPRPADMIFLYFIGFFIFLLMLRVGPWLSLLGALAFAFSSYHFIIIEAGHNSKAVAIAYMAPVMGAIIYTFRGHLWAGSILFAIFMALQLFANHFQITYYLGIIAVSYGIFQFSEHLQKKEIARFFQKTGILVAALVLAIGINIGNFWSTYAYTPETMRGGSELTIGEETQTGGLSKEYITNWSYGIDETLSLIIPNMKGGATGPLGQSEKALEKADPTYRNIVANENHYWGDQPFTSGPVYVGVVVIFFFFLALFYVKGSLKWGFLIATILSIVLAWGKNFMPLTDLFIEFVPGYDKFRAVSMTLVIAEFCIPALAFLGLHHWIKNPHSLKIKDRAFVTALGLTAGLSALFYLFPRVFFSFISSMEAEAYADLAASEPQMRIQVMDMLNNLESARAAIFRADALRSLIFALLAGGITLALARKKIGKTAFFTLLALLLVADMWPVNRRYLNNDHFVPRRQAERPFPIRTADRYIMQDTDIFRVLDISENTFNSSRTSYYHQSIGGYHGAKLQRYQDMIDFHILEEMQFLNRGLRQSGSMEEVVEYLRQMPVLAMLNTRYIIYNANEEPLFNALAMGNAWFVDSLAIVDNADAEITALGSFNPQNKAIADRHFEDMISRKVFERHPTNEIELISYSPNHLIYESRTQGEQLAVFSEIFYPEGWKATINGEPAEHFRVNYVLRAMVLPPGAHTIEFRFEPASYHKGKQVSLVFSILLVVAVLVYGFFKWRSCIKDNNCRQA